MVAEHRGTHPHGLAARGDADPPAVHAVACTCMRSSAGASARSSSSPTGGCSRSTAARSSAGGSPTSIATSRSASTSSCSPRWRAASTPSLFRVSIYQTVRRAGPEPNLTALAEAVDYCAEAIESSGDCKVDRGEFRQAELWPSSLPLGRDVSAQGAQVPDASTPATCCRWSAPGAGRRPGSRSRSPTPAAPSSC